MDCTLSSIDRWMPDIYVRQILCFSSGDHESAIAILRAGLEKTIAQLRFLSASIRRNDNCKTRSSLQIGDSEYDIDEIFSCQDLSDVLDFGSLREAYFPVQLFDAAYLTPPSPPPIAAAGAAPVTRVRVTCVKNGLLVCVCLHHCAVDMAGFGTVLKVWAASTNGENYNILQPACLDRRALSRLISNEHAKDLSHEFHLVQAPDEQSPKVESQKRAGSDPSELETALVYFSPDSLRQLKAEAHKHFHLSPSGWLSTNDALTALVWCSLKAAREPEAEAAGLSTIRISMNIRKLMDPPLPQDYIGNAVAMAWPTATNGMLFQGANDLETMMQVAGTIRTSLLDVSADHVRSLVVHHLDMKLDVPGVVWGLPTLDTLITTWAEQATYSLEWHPTIGNCEAVRHAKMKTEICLILPRLSDGGLEMMIPLKKDVMKRLRKTPLLQRFAIWRSSCKECDC